MKKINKILSILLAFVMVFAFVSPLAKAAGEEEAKTNKVILHKLLMSEDELKKWNPKSITEEQYDGTQNLEQFAKQTGKELKEIKNVYFAFQNKEGKWINQEGKVVENVDEALGGLTKDNGLELETSKLPEGEYKIVEVTEKSTYVGENGETLTGQKAVPVMITLPMYNSKGLVEEAHVYPKNSEDKPQIDKNFAKDTEGAKDTELKLDDNQRGKDTINRGVGDEVKYQVETKIPKDAKYKKLVLTDSMTKGLTFGKNLKLTPEAFKENTDYKLYSDDHGFRLVFTKDGLEKLQQEAKGKELTIRLEYSAKINGDAVVDKEDINDIALDYSNKPGSENEPITGKPKDKEIKVEKTWASDGKEITEADKTVTATFILQEKQDNGTWKDVDSHTVTSAEKFEHTFKNLNNEKEYRVIERVVGYEPEYVSFEDGKVKIVDKKDSTNPKPINPSEPKVVTGGKKFVKTNQDGKIRLAGAEFVVAKSDKQYLGFKSESDANADVKAYEEAEKAYKEAVAKVTISEDGTINYGDTSEENLKKLKETRDKAFAKSREQYTWVESSDKAIKFTTNELGQFEVTGLAYGTYKLVETKAPKGYAAQFETFDKGLEFKIEKGTYSSGTFDYEKDSNIKDATQIINKKVTIPQTGGIGTLIFTVVGLSVMAAAGVVLVKNNKKDEIA